MGPFAESRIRSSPAATPETEGTVDDGVTALLNHVAFSQAVCLLASGLFDTHKLAPRAAALFATQQRWLLSHAALAHHFQPFDQVEPCVSRRSLGLIGPLLGIASRNTSRALFDEAAKYGVLDLLEEHGAHREQLAAPSSNALSLIGLWYGQHFAALDLLDGGTRQSRFQARSHSLLPRMQPLVARGLLSSPGLRAPGPLYTIFTWSDSGGWLMDRLIAGIDWERPQGQDRFLTDVRSITFLAESAKLSRSHTSRKLSEAQSIGGLGWTGRPGRSPLWISHEFYTEYAEFQARKLLILDHALTEVTAMEASQGGRWE
ncbi:hypothetical protein ABID16_002580 [Rhizobium aquaticum]|uniref:Uncharacterized protein n=1 Tax=Rhizobium aquaticum TaxID=1549636 RepID=A0ABV2J0M0_9HYPH